MNSILVVCTANLCRSPMAAALLGRCARRRRVTSSIGSAGVEARPGARVSRGSVRAMALRGLDISGHRSRLVTPQLLAQADLVVTMESAHVVQLVAAQPWAIDRTFTLKELATAAPASGLVPGAARGAWVGQLADGRSVREMLGRSDLDVADPIGRSPSHFRRCASELERLCETLATGLWGVSLE